MITIMSLPRLCSDTDLKEFCPQSELWLKPHSRITITVTLPTLETVGQCISTWEVMDKLKKRAKPHRFKSLKVVKSNVDFIRFEAECDSKQSMDLIVVRLNNVTLKLSGFSQTLHVKTAKVKIGSTRHEWESFFRDNPNMNEMKAGYRPDTIHLQNLPVKWFGGDNPSANLIVKVFSTFGEIRRFHIPILDNNKSEENEAFKRFSFNESLNFEAYVQYRDYIGFVNAMDTLRGMKLVKKLSELTNQKNQHIEYDIIVDFDRTKHLSDKAIKKRRIAREYGIKSAVDLKNLKDETRKQRQKYLERINFLKSRKRSANCVLDYLFNLAENKAKIRKQIEDSKQAELKLKERLLTEEVKLREKLLEKRREYLRQQSKGKLKSVANFNNALNNAQILSEASSPPLSTLPSIAMTVSSATSSNLTSVVLSNVTANKIHLNRINRFSEFDLRNSLTNNNNHNNLHNNSHNQYYNINSMNSSSLYKNHKRGCKYYKPRSIVITKKL